MADPCCNSFGGRISIDIDGIRYSARGDISINPTNTEVSGDANHDGTPYFVSKPVLYGAEFSFSQPCGIKWSNELAKCAVNVTIKEDDNGRVHLFTAARIVGRPKLNLSTGEVSGLSILSGQYQQTGV